MTFADILRKINEWRFKQDPSSGHVLYLNEKNMVAPYPVTHSTFLTVPMREDAQEFLKSVECLAQMAGYTGKIYFAHEEDLITFKLTYL